ncbi:TetR/AcrR family transcriptional regulator [Streptomyces sp. NPDC093795]|uniref:TetR/AcrR family transcriptional regulator n=1 Tax=Streptomyces sp. NPDC093795 TaxID=3366051 RepID=UPI0037FE5A83
MATRRLGRAEVRTPRARGNAASGRRAELLRIAAGQFASHGFAATTVRDIADEAGILSGSLYHHFRSKEEMLDEILRDFLGSLFERFQEIEKEGEGPREVLDGLIQHSFTTIHERPEAVALYQNESGSLSGLPGFEYVDEFSKKIERIWLGALTAGQKSGVFPDDIDVKLNYLFIRDTVWSAVRWYRPGGKYRPETLAAQYLRVLHTGLLAT